MALTAAHWRHCCSLSRQADCHSRVLSDSVRSETPYRVTTEPSARRVRLRRRGPGRRLESSQ
eukprot:199571-Hanusia_phi.AAC.1